MTQDASRRKYLSPAFLNGKGCYAHLVDGFLKAGRFAGRIQQICTFFAQRDYATHEGFLSMNTTANTLASLKLWQLADSAVPIGSAAHSFGLETLTERGDLSEPQLAAFFTALLYETGRLEAAYGAAAHALGQSEMQTAFAERWQAMNERLGALKLARESRTASATLGRRLLRLTCDLEAAPVLEAALRGECETHLCTVFGLIGAILGIDAVTTLSIYVHQSLAALISACQRLLPLGQYAASQLLWQLKPIAITVAEQGIITCKDLETAGSFAPLAEMGSLCHPCLRTRLFIS
jgi:urease accessory protein